MRFIRVLIVTVISLSLALPMAVAAESATKEKKEGAEIFKSKCATCHGAEGTANTTMAKTMKVRDMRSAEVQKQTKEELIKIITNGKGKMPAFKGKLSKDQIDDVVTYIKSLKK